MEIENRLLQPDRAEPERIAKQHDSKSDQHDGKSARGRVGAAARDDCAAFIAIYERKTRFRMAQDHDHAHDDHDHHHDHEHGAELSEMQIRVRALESILTEKGYVEPAALDAIIEAYETKIGPHNGARVVAKAWTDPAFKQALLH